MICFLCIALSHVATGTAQAAPDAALCDSTPLLQAADDALYQAKRQGRNRGVVAHVHAEHVAPAA